MSRLVRALRRVGVVLVGLALAAVGLVTAVTTTTRAAEAAPLSLPYSCTTTFASGFAYTADDVTLVENHSTDPNIAQLTVTGPVDNSAGALAHSFTGATYWETNDATITWNGVRSPEASFRWTVYPDVIPATFAPAAFAVPEIGIPGVMEWDFVADATIPPSPGPGYDAGHTTCTPAPDLTVSVSHVGDFATGGIAAHWDIVVTNESPWPTNGTPVTVSDILPAEVATWIGGRGHNPDGWSGSLSDMVYTRSDVLAPGQSYPPIALYLEIPATLTHPVVNTVTVKGGGDQTPANDTATDQWTFRGYQSAYSTDEATTLDRVATFLGGVSREDAQRTGALFLAYLDGLVQAQHLTPPAFGSMWPWNGFRQTRITSQYSDAENASVLATASDLSTDVPTLQWRGVQLIGFLLAISR